MKIPLGGLGGGYSAQIDDADAALVAGYHWGVVRQARNLYALAHTKRADGKWRPIKMHRLIRPEIPKIDHKDGNGLNNTRDNLRAATKSQNAANCRAHRDGSSGFKGVSFRRDRPNPWRARIFENGREKMLGYFATREGAALAYNNAAIRLHGEFARLNAIRKPVGRAQASLPFSESEAMAA
jgi:hypothetical protein